jgi:hypothetical protein
MRFYPGDIAVIADNTSVPELDIGTQVEVEEYMGDGEYVVSYQGTDYVVEGIDLDGAEV